MAKEKPPLISSPTRFSGTLKRLMESVRYESRPIDILLRLQHRLRGEDWRQVPAEFQAGFGPYCYRCKTTRILNRYVIGHCFSFREKRGLISYMPKHREQIVDDNNRWRLEGRQAMKPAAWLRQMFSERAIKLLRFKDEDFAVFATALKHEEEKHDSCFEYVPFEAGYDRSRYYDGNMIESCMWNDPVEEFYEDHFDCQLLVCRGKEHGLLKGRAIVWTNVEMRIDGNNDWKEVVVMDRIYADSVETQYAFINHAREQGWFYKYKQSAQCMTDFIAPWKDGTRVAAHAKVAARATISAEYYPYLDTFRFGDDDEIANYPNNRPYVYSQTDGTRKGERDPHEGMVCDVEGDWIDECDAVYVQNVGFMHAETEGIVAVDDEFYLSSDRRVCQSMPHERWARRDECVYIEGEYWEACSDQIEYSAGAWRLRSQEPVVGEIDPLYMTPEAVVTTTSEGQPVVAAYLPTQTEDDPQQERLAL